MARLSALFSCLLGGAMCLIVFSFENVALNKSAWQQDTKFSLLANRGVDGHKSYLHMYSEECVTSRYNATSAWRVDLEKVLSIHHISIQFATNNYSWNKDNELTKYFLGFSVYLSNTTEKEDGILCFRDTTYTRATIPNPVIIPCPHFGRYVIYYNNRTHPPYPDGYSDTTINALCEVEVYGCSDQGKFGENCSMLCPPKCLKSRCDITTGTCFECTVGYLGPTCESESSTAWINSENSTTWMEGTNLTTRMEGNPNMNSLYVKGIDKKKSYIFTPFSLYKSKSILFADSLKIPVKTLSSCNDRLSFCKKL
uniref:Uncharacterized protein LOC111101490 n=1 Tax=Crassostrea virginica TaxID=6565 RepID=A0A8B8AEW5_CRAVI|nr:uncharacterized protein LOC111101490 [Crassostrea virginica]XP_022289716.1 uncharacterized protein LOC111101490 [Crassostrea virginica]